MKFLFVLLTVTALFFSTSAFATFPGQNGKIAFSYGHTIAVSNSDGSNEVVFNFCMNGGCEFFGPKWSPDGTKLVFYSMAAGNPGIYVMNSDGSNLYAVKSLPASTPGATNSNTRFSPDGTRIFYHNGIYPYDWQINLDGSNDQPLFPSPTIYLDLAFSPDGQRVAGVWGCDIYVMDPDGSNPVNITHNPEIGCSANPEWYPYGHAQLLDLYGEDHCPSSDDCQPGQSSVRVIASDGSYLYPVMAPTETQIGFPVWSPDGTKIAYDVGNAGAADGIYVMNADGTNSVHLDHPQQGSNRNTDWQPIPGYAPPTPPAPSYTGSGVNVSVRPIDTTTGRPAPATITFSAVSQPGDTTLTSNTSGPAAPPGYRSINIYSNVSTTASYSGNITECLSWKQGQFYFENDVKLFQYVAGAWVDITSSVDTSGNQACGHSYTLSLFGLFEPNTVFQNGKIAFATYDRFMGYTGISIMNADGLGEIQLTNNDDRNPRFSRDGSKILFLRANESSLYTMNVDGTDLKKVPISGSGDFDLSPDGNQIVFVTNSVQLLTENIDGSNRHELPIPTCTESELQGRGVEKPLWSPDGTKIAFDVLCWYGSGGYSNIYTMNADGSNIRQVTNDTLVAGMSVYNYYPAWAPDGNKLVFTHETFPLDFSSDQFSMVTINADGTNRTVLPVSPNQIFTDAVWSPDGTKILFDGGRFEGPYTSMANGVIYSINPEGTSLVQIGYGSELRTQPAWQPVPVQASQNTQTGTNVDVTPTDPSTGQTPVSLTFSSITNTGTTSITSSTQGPPAPSSYKLGTPPVYYELATTASFSGPVTLCFSWQQGQFGNETTIKLFHYQNNAWVNITTSLDTIANKVCGQTSSFSPFALFESAYNFSGFFSPVDNTPTYNRVKAGSAVPVKFSLGANLGLNILTAGSPSSAPINCSNASVDDVEQTVTASNSSLTYDAVANQYIYTWKTDKTWASTCRQLTLRLNDGTSHIAFFTFTK